MIEGLKDIGVTFYYKEKDKIRLHHITETIDTVKKNLFDVKTLYDRAKNKLEYKKMESEKIIEEDDNFLTNIYRIAQEQYEKFEEPYRVNTVTPPPAGKWLGTIWYYFYYMKTWSPTLAHHLLSISEEQNKLDLLADTAIEDQERQQKFEKDYNRQIRYPFPKIVVSDSLLLPDVVVSGEAISVPDLTLFRDHHESMKMEMAAI